MGLGLGLGLGRLGLGSAVRVGVRVPVDGLARLHTHHGRHVPHLGRVRGEG